MPDLTKVLGVINKIKKRNKKVIKNRIFFEYCWKFAKGFARIEWPGRKTKKNCDERKSPLFVDTPAVRKSLISCFLSLNNRNLILMNKN